MGEGGGGFLALESSCAVPPPSDLAPGMAVGTPVFPGNAQAGGGRPGEASAVEHRGLATALWVL